MKYILTAFSILTFFGLPMLHGSVASAMPDTDPNEIFQIEKPTKIDEADFEARYTYSLLDPEYKSGNGDYPFTLQIGKRFVTWKGMYKYGRDSIYYALPGNTIRRQTFDSIERHAPRGLKLLDTYLDLEKPDSVLCQDSYIGTFKYLTHTDATPAINWQLTDETKTIRGFECRKAEADFSGQHWTVWYCEDYPVMYGPWKLHGLPGLIVDASTERDGHVFELTSILKRGAPMFGAQRGPDVMVVSAEKLRKFKELFARNIKLGADFLGDATNWMPDFVAARRGPSNYIEK